MLYKKRILLLSMHTQGGREQRTEGKLNLIMMTVYKRGQTSLIIKGGEVRGGVRSPTGGLQRYLPYSTPWCEGVKKTGYFRSI